MIAEDAWQQTGIWGDPGTPSIVEEAVREDLTVEVLLYHQGMRVLTEGT